MYGYGFPLDLLGDRLLSGVWMETLDKDRIGEIYGDNYLYGNEHCESWIILLDGRLWRITEDPDDGYRSHCRNIQEITNIMPVNWWQTSEPVTGYVVNEWPGSWDYDNNGGHAGEWWLPEWVPPEDTGEKHWRTERCELLVLVSRTTNKPVCIFGTDNTEDYYPMYVGKFMPENMGINEGRDEPVTTIDVTGRTQQ